MELFKWQLNRFHSDRYLLYFCVSKGIKGAFGLGWWCMWEAWPTRSDKRSFIGWILNFFGVQGCQIVRMNITNFMSSLKLNNPKYLMHLLQKRSIKLFSPKKKKTISFPLYTHFYGTLCLRHLQRIYTARAPYN